MSLQLYKRLLPLEHAIRNQLLPAIFGSENSDELRDLISLPTKYGGMDITNPANVAESWHQNSLYITKPISDAIIRQEHQLDISIVKEQRKRCSDTKKKLQVEHQTAMRAILENTTKSGFKRLLEACIQRGSSAWLSTLPIESEGFSLHKSDFRDAILLRCGLPISNLPCAMCL